MKAPVVCRVGSPSVHGLHTMAPTLDSTIYYSDGSTRRNSVVLEIRPSPCTVNLRFLFTKDGSCVGSFDCMRRDETLNLFMDSGELFCASNALRSGGAK